MYFRKAGHNMMVKLTSVFKPNLSHKRTSIQSSCLHLKFRHQHNFLQRSKLRCQLQILLFNKNYLNFYPLSLTLSHSLSPLLSFSLLLTLSLSLSLNFRHFSFINFSHYRLLLSPSMTLELTDLKGPEG